MLSTCARTVQWFQCHVRMQTLIVDCTWPLSMHTATAQKHCNIGSEAPSAAEAQTALQHRSVRKRNAHHVRGVGLNCSAARRGSRCGRRRAQRRQRNQRRDNCRVCLTAGAPATRGNPRSVGRKNTRAKALREARGGVGCGHPGLLLPTRRVGGGGADKLSCSTEDCPLRVQGARLGAEDDWAAPGVKCKPRACKTGSMPFASATHIVVGSTIAATRNRTRRRASATLFVLFMATKAARVGIATKSLARQGALKRISCSCAPSGASRLESQRMAPMEYRLNAQG